MKKIFWLFIVSAMHASLFFSEYAEGTSNNKYLEIYNASNQTIDLTQYAYPSVSNGPTDQGVHEYWNEFDPGASVAPGQVYAVSYTHLTLPTIYSV